MIAEDVRKRGVHNQCATPQVLEIGYLGRKDSNLRMTVPKTVWTHWIRAPFLRINSFVHRLKSIAYGQSAERTEVTRPPSNDVLTTREGGV